MLLSSKIVGIQDMPKNERVPLGELTNLLCQKVRLESY